MSTPHTDGIQQPCQSELTISQKSDPEYDKIRDGGIRALSLYHCQSPHKKLPVSKRCQIPIASTTVFTWSTNNSYAEKQEITLVTCPG
jgi:hypothetical protein